MIYFFNLITKQSKNGNYIIIEKIETKRLVIRKFSDKDIDGLYKLLSNEQVMRYIEKTYTFDQKLSFLKSMH